MNIAPDLMTHRARGCPFIANVDGEDFVIDGFAKYKGYGDECKTIYFAGVALFQCYGRMDDQWSYFSIRVITALK